MTIKQLTIAFVLFIVTASLSYLGIKLLSTSTYQSTLVIYPPNTHINEHLIDAGLSFGGEKEISEYIEILNSLDVLDSMVQKHNLIKHYGLDLKENSGKEAVKLFQRRIEITRSMNKSIHIQVEDEDQEMAVALALSMVDIADHHKSQLIKDNLATPFKEAKMAYESKKEQVSQLESSLRELENEGAYVWNEGIENSSLEFQIQNLKYKSEFEWLSRLKENYEKLKMNFQQETPKSYIISKPSTNSLKKLPNSLRMSFLIGLCASLVFLFISVFKDKIIIGDK